MVYTSPTKVSRIVELRSLGLSQQNIGVRTGIHRTTVARILKRYEKTHDPYYTKPKVGRPRKLNDHDIREGAHMLARAEVSNATELAHVAFPDVSRQTVACALKEYGLVCRVRRSRPYICLINQKKRLAWARQHTSAKCSDPLLCLLLTYCV